MSEVKRPHFIEKDRRICKILFCSEKVTLGSLSARIKEKTGIEYTLDKEVADTGTSVKFQSLSIEKSFEKILSKLDEALR